MSTVLTLRRDPVRLLLSRGLWAGAWYLLAYQVIGGVLFAIALSVALTGAVLCITLAGIPLLIAAAAAIRWCANVERARLLPFCGDVGSQLPPAGRRPACCPGSASAGGTPPSGATSPTCSACSCRWSRST